MTRGTVRTSAAFVSRTIPNKQELQVSAFVSGASLFLLRPSSMKCHYVIYKIHVYCKNSLHAAVQWAKLWNIHCSCHKLLFPPDLELVVTQGLQLHTRSCNCSPQFLSGAAPLENAVPQHLRRYTENSGPSGRR